MSTIHWFLTLVLAPLLLGYNGNSLIEAAKGGKCPKIKKPENGQSIGQCRRQIGDQCEFACRAPYVLRGSRIRVCQDDGTWSGSTSYCQLSSCDNCQTQCSAQIPPPNGRLEGPCNPGIPGEACFFYCNNGYYLNGNAAMTCLNNGLWRGQRPRCLRATCTEDFGNLGSNIRVQCQNSNGGRVCTFSCSRGYRLVGNAVVSCYNQDGWSGDIPRCQRVRCPNVNIQGNTIVTDECISRNYQETCTITCRSGFRLIGPSSITCQENGMWNAAPPVCQRTSRNSCSSLSAPANGVISGQCSPGVVGRWCNLTCNNGFRAGRGVMRLLCMVNGEWSGQFSRCQRTSGGQCPTLGGIQNGIMSGQCAPGRLNQICSFSCYNGFRLVGSNTLICQQNGQWSSSVPQCRSNACPTLVPPRDGTLTGTCSGAREGDSCRFSCFNNFQLLGDSVLICTSSGTWSNSVPVCRGSSGCARLSPPANGQFTQCDNNVGGQCITSCNQGYARSGSEVRVCQQNGRWSGTGVSCRRVVGFRVVPLWTLIFG